MINGEFFKGYCIYKKEANTAIVEDPDDNASVVSGEYAASAPGLRVNPTEDIGDKDPGDEDEVFGDDDLILEPEEDQNDKEE